MNYVAYYINDHFPDTKSLLDINGQICALEKEVSLHEEKVKEIKKRYEDKRQLFCETKENHRKSVKDVGEKLSIIKRQYMGEKEKIEGVYKDLKGLHSAYNEVLLEEKYDSIVKEVDQHGKKIDNLINNRDVCLIGGELFSNFRRIYTISKILNGLNIFPNLRDYIHNIVIGKRERFMEFIVGSLKHGMNGMNVEGAEEDYKLISTMVNLYVAFLKVENQGMDCETYKFDDMKEVLFVVLRPINVKLHFHFTGDKKTNDFDNTDWFFRYSREILEEKEDFLDKIDSNVTEIEFKKLYICGFMRIFCDCVLKNISSTENKFKINEIVMKCMVFDKSVRKRFHVYDEEGSFDIIYGLDKSIINDFLLVEEYKNISFLEEYVLGEGYKEFWDLEKPSFLQTEKQWLNDIKNRYISVYKGLHVFVSYINNITNTYDGLNNKVIIDEISSRIITRSFEDFSSYLLKEVRDMDIYHKATSLSTLDYFSKFICYVKERGFLVDIEDSLFSTLETTMDSIIKRVVHMIFNKVFFFIDSYIASKYMEKNHNLSSSKEILDACLTNRELLRNLDFVRERSTEEVKIMMDRIIRSSLTFVRNMKSVLTSHCYKMLVVDIADRLQNILINDIVMCSQFTPSGSVKAVVDFSYIICLFRCTYSIECELFGVLNDIVRILLMRLEDNDDFNRLSEELAKENYFKSRHLMEKLGIENMETQSVLLLYRSFVDF